MGDERREYQRSWLSNKRRLLRYKRKQETAIQLSSDSSDSEEMHYVAMGTVSDSRDKNENEISTGSSSHIAEMFDHASEDEESWDVIDKWNEAMNFDSESDCEDDRPAVNLKSKLQSWAVECGVTWAQLDKLLPILREVDNSLPLSAKTLLKPSTSSMCQPRTISGGDYIYLGVSAGLNIVLANKTDLDSTNMLELALNVDGVPLYHSSTYSLWPVLCYITNVKPHRVFVVSVFGGKSKPSDVSFLDEAVEELRNILTEGLSINGKQYRFLLKYCVCDAPARAMVKCTKLFSGYYGCDKCSQRGEFIGRMTYPLCEAPFRTDSDFRLQANKEHHNGVSPFSMLPVDMVGFFPIDYMHQVCLGVVKRLLLCWTSGSKRVKLSAAQKMEVNSRLHSLRSAVPCEFNRKPRSLSELSHWKATEFRSFLLYFGYFVLNKIASKEVVEHFACLSVALRVFTSDVLSSNTEYRTFAHNMLLYFVSKCAEIYCPEFLVYNVHSLVHLSKEVEMFGNLDNCSAFIFENYMQKLKHSVRGTCNPIVQVVNRLHEERCFMSHNQSLPDDQSSLPANELGSFNCKPPNNCFIIVESGWCCQVVNVENQRAACMIFKKSEPVFMQPCDSRIIGLHAVHRSRGVMKFIPLRTMVGKAMSFVDFTSERLIFIQLVHSLQ